MSTGFVPSSVSTVCVTRQPWAAAKSRHFCPGWRILYAQARVYDRVKNWNRLNFLFSIIVPLLLSFVTVYNRSREFVDSELLSSLLGLYGLLVLTFNIVISGHISALRRKAASIQEMYDCRVLGIRRNELKVEEIPRDDIIREAALLQIVGGDKLIIPFC